MRDRLMPGGDELSRWSSCLPLEVDGGAEGEHAGEDAGDEAGGSLRQATLEQELVLERLHDRLDPLANEAERRLGSLGLVGATGWGEECAELVHRLLGVAA